MTPPHPLNRREFLGAALAASLASPIASSFAAPAASLWSKLPRWRGFNLIELFYRNQPFAETDFAWISEWGFDFVRLPCDYQQWADPNKSQAQRDSALANLDRAVELGRKHGIHVCINLHNAPGYSVNASAHHKLSLWKDDEARRQFADQWTLLAKRYRGIDSSRVSFDLLNEPADVHEDTYVASVTPAIKAIHAVDPDRLVLSDGLNWGNKPIPSLKPLHVAQMTRGYQPFQLTHYKASWVHGERFPLPHWPLPQKSGPPLDRDWLKRTCIDPWKQLADSGVGVMVGEWGAYKYTPHDVVLRWAKDQLELWQTAGFGWAMWNFRGTFGILDSKRDDVHYQTHHGHALDRQYLDLLRAH